MRSSPSPGNTVRLGGYIFVRKTPIRAYNIGYIQLRSRDTTLVGFLMIANCEDLAHKARSFFTRMALSLHIRACLILRSDLAAVTDGFSRSRSFRESYAMLHAASGFGAYRRAHDCHFASGSGHQKPSLKRDGARPLVCSPHIPSFFSSIKFAPLRTFF